MPASPTEKEGMSNNEGRNEKGTRGIQNEKKTKLIYMGDRISVPI